MDKKRNPLTIFIASDGLAEYGELLAKAASHHFDSFNTEIVVSCYIKETAVIDEIIGEAAGKKAIIIGAFTLPELNKHLFAEAAKKNVVVHDVLNPFLDRVKKVTGQAPILDSQIRTPLDEDYFEKIDAIEFTVKYDDGKRSDGLDEADVVLLGVSRSSKTPISIYLANNNYKVANFPIMPESKPPDELFDLPKEKIFGLVIKPEKLVSIREERLRAMNLGGNSNYASQERVDYELDFAMDLFKRLDCTVIDVTSKAIEEIANFILATIRGGN